MRIAGEIDSAVQLSSIGSRLAYGWISMSDLRTRALQALAGLTARVGRSKAEAEVNDAALDALEEAIGATRAAVLFIEPDGVMRFHASRGISPEYRKAAEGHAPWSP